MRPSNGGPFYSGQQTTVTVNQSRVGVTTALAIEPSYTLNKVELVEAIHQPPVRLAGHLHDDAADVRQALSCKNDSATGAASANTRPRWEYQPGSELFVVYARRQEHLLAWRAGPIDRRSIIVKVKPAVSATEGRRRSDRTKEREKCARPQLAERTQGHGQLVACVQVRGISVADAACMRRVAGIIEAEPGSPLTVSVGLPGAVTDDLLALVSAAERQEPSGRSPGSPPSAAHRDCHRDLHRPRTSRRSPLSSTPTAADIERRLRKTAEAGVLEQRNA